MDAALSGAPARRSRRTDSWKRAILAFFGLAVACLLTACGAVIDTTLVVNDDGSGKRTITATVDGSDLDEVDGGADAIETTITENIPSGMEYNGQKAGGDDGVVFSFAIEFESQKDYTEKVIGILGAGGVTDIETEIEIVVADSVFREGVSVQENFTSQDLLQWLVEAMVDDGLVDDSDADDLSELGKTVVEVDGVGHDTSSAIDYSDISDYGIRDLSVVTEGLETGSYTRTISYDLSRETYSRDAAGYDEFFTSATPKGGELTEPDEASTIWTISFTAKNEKQLIEYTNTALNSTETDFAVASEADEGDPTMFRTAVVDYLECGQICNADVEISESLALPDGWDSSQASNGEDGWLMPISHEPVEFSHRVQFQSVVAAVTATPSGENALLLSYALSPENAEAVGDAIEDVIAPASNRGELSVNADKDAVTYTVTLKGDDPSELDDHMQEYLPGSKYSLVESDSTLFTKSYDVGLVVALPRDLLSGGVEKGIEYRVELPSGATVGDGSDVPKGATIDGNIVALTEQAPTSPQFAIEANGLNIAGIIMLGVIVLVVLLAIAAVVFFVLRQRKKRKDAPPNELFSYDSEAASVSLAPPAPFAPEQSAGLETTSPNTLTATAVLDDAAPPLPQSQDALTEQIPEPDSDSPTEILPPRPPLPPTD
ncbi:hypothetical protein ACSAGD_00940 [Paramicrobacterium sp. CJ85]|uniref:hypothetical protein n=1 Tax=Paramicrobacterium sp. CJ85 TaxID=3445355 RepID=UPI003F5E39C1